jgi:hypothetical protein
MGCSDCKKKDKFRERMEREISNNVPTLSWGVVWFVIIWSLLAIYGIYSLIKLL